MATHCAQCQAMGIMISPAWAAPGLFFHEKKKKLNKINLFVAGFYFHQVFTGFCGGKKQAQRSFHLASDGCSSAIPQALPQHLPFQNQSSCCSSTQSHPKPPPREGPEPRGLLRPQHPPQGLSRNTGVPSKPQKKILPRVSASLQLGRNPAESLLSMLIVLF